jgi:hemolysin III
MNTFSTASPPTVRPLLRGWSHALATGAAVVATAALASRTADDPARLASLLVYGASLILLFGASAIYHLGGWQGQRRAFFRAIDHAGIFVVIAGTYTPVGVIVLAGGLGTAMLVFIWLLAAIGVVISAAPIELPRWIRVGLYACMGWTAVVPTAALVQALPLTATALVVVGGVLYSIGAVIYARRRPDPLPRIFGFHELFHLLVIAGCAAQFAVIWIWVVPFGRA